MVVYPFRWTFGKPMRESRMARSKGRWTSIRQNTTFQIVCTSCFELNLYVNCTPEQLKAPTIDSFSTWWMSRKIHCAFKVVGMTDHRPHVDIYHTLSAPRMAFADSSNFTITWGTFIDHSTITKNATKDVKKPYRRSEQFSSRPHPWQFAHRICRSSNPFECQFHRRRIRLVGSSSTSLPSSHSYRPFGSHIQTGRYWQRGGPLPERTCWRWKVCYCAKCSS